MIFKGFRAQRAAQGDSPIAMFNSSEPFSCGDTLLTNSALHRFDIDIAGVEIGHKLPFLENCQQA